MYGILTYRLKYLHFEKVGCAKFSINICIYMPLYVRCDFIWDTYLSYIFSFLPCYYMVDSTISTSSSENLQSSETTSSVFTSIGPAVGSDINEGMVKFDIYHVFGLSDLYQANDFHKIN